MGEITLAQALNRAIDEAMADDPGVFCLGEDVAAKQGGGVFKITSGLSEKYGEHRVRATPISETAIVGAAVGAALAGQRPIAEIMLMNFVGVCMDQIVNHAAKLRFMSGGQTNVPLVIRTTTGVGVGFGGQHSDMLEAWFAHVAGLHVVTPSNAADARGLMRSAIECNDPVIFIENILCYGLKSEDPGPGYRVPMGKAAVAREGSDISLITYGRTVLDALAVAGELASEGISVEVIDLRTIAPYDEAAVLASVRKTGLALTLHEAVRPFGTGAELAATIQEKCWDYLKGPVRRVGGTFSPVPFATVLEQAWIPTKAQIIEQIKAALGRS
ncbi:alpha-ketoacid dehydrogenase subunit beta [Novosphingobium sp.]|uniref:alpha-ketoacid dehydrogenase subunit beta n=1 Tax=Novosphingobium sp. TaxID=1874826 RepID=UPI0025DDD120|nr:alpha-ketoacid dehydrogenase subunit beta [Novosphingobium sp.]